MKPDRERCRDRLPLRSELSEMQDKLPALQFRQEAERRHARTCIAGRDLPVQLAVGLALNGKAGEIRSLGCPAAVSAMACAASLQKQLATTTDDVGTIEERIHFRTCCWRSDPRRIIRASPGKTR